jgi:hypothetical protein
VPSLIQARVRAEAGNPTTTEISDSDILQLITDCLEIISNYIPAWKIAYITTVVNQQDYLVDTDAINVLFCDWTSSAKLSDIFAPDFPITTLYDIETGIFKKIRDALERAELVITTNWFFREYDRKLFLAPPPITADQKVYYIAQVDWTMATLPTRFEKYFVWYCLSEALFIVSRRRRRLSSVSHSGGLSQWNDQDPSDAKELRIRFDDALLAEARKALF